MAVAVTERDSLYHTVRAHGEYPTHQPGPKAKIPRSKMSWWSKHDPVSMSKGPTDYWAKMKLNASTFQVSRSPSGDIKMERENRLIDLKELVKKSGSAKQEEKKTVRFTYNPDGTVSKLPGDEDFHTVVSKSLNSNLPGSYFLTKPRSSPSRVSLRTSYNERARSGNKYWYQERPKPTTFGRYSMGSYKTFMGLGNAPRS